MFETFASYMERLKSPYDIEPSPTNWQRLLPNPQKAPLRMNWQKLQPTIQIPQDFIKICPSCKKPTRKSELARYGGYCQECDAMDTTTNYSRKNAERSYRSPAQKAKILATMGSADQEY
jgi:hypothetical protein